jgi:SAM-dependent methyltransferase
MNQTENKSVLDIYNSISNHFDNTRHYIWPSVKEFIKSLPKYSYIGDIGCGNGKNMQYLSDTHYFLGIDFSIKFLEICRKKKLEVFTSNNYTLPLKDNTFDHCISIAVIHHLSTQESRIKCISELLRITKPNGLIMIQVWAFERDYNKEYENQDAMIPWKSKQKTYYRYYYLFKENELETLINKSAYKTNIIKSYKERDNYIVIISKV